MITGINNGSLKEIMDQSLVDLKAASKYLTAKLNNGSKLSVIMANNRGFRIALDYTRNVTVGYMDPAGGALRSPQPSLCGRCPKRIEAFSLPRRTGLQELCD